MRRLVILGALMAALAVLGGCNSSEDHATGPTTPSDYSISITAAPESLPADGQSQSTIVVTVVDLYGDPVPGVLVLFTHSRGVLEAYEYSASAGGWDTSDTPRTSSTGMVFAILTSEKTPGTAVVTATVENETVTIYVPFV